MAQDPTTDHTHSDANTESHYAGGVPGKDTHTSIMHEMIIITVLFLLLVPAIWIALSSKDSKDLKEEKTLEKIEFDNALSAAHKMFSRDHLSWPEENNAFKAYLQAQELKENSSKIPQGLKLIGSRYTELLEALLEEQDFVLFDETWERAERFGSYTEDPFYIQSLEALRLRREQAEHTLTQNHETLLSQSPDSYKPLSIVRDPLKSGQKAPPMIVLPGGQFLFGSPGQEPGRDSDEGPQVEIQIESFAIGQTEVTFEEYTLFASATGRAIPDDEGWGRGKHPVINVSWLDARAYAIWLSQETGFRYRLPTESEWEYAARAGNQTTFAYGPCVAQTQANINGANTEAYHHCPKFNEVFNHTLEVKTLNPNDWGLHNVHGNVREWVRDCWITSYTDQPKNGGAVYLAEGGGCSIAGGKRVLRGGDWSSTMRTARIANRFALHEREADGKFGIRLARDILAPQ